MILSASCSIDDYTSGVKVNMHTFSMWYGLVHLKGSTPCYRMILSAGCSIDDYTSGVKVNMHTFGMWYSLIHLEGP